MCFHFAAAFMACKPLQNDNTSTHIFIKLVIALFLRVR